jgi:ketosteroid isomerase-like protein
VRAVRALIVGAALGALVISLTACGGTSTSAPFERDMQLQVDRYAIGEVERSFHEAISKKNINQMMSLFAPNATMRTPRPGKTVTGKQQIRNVWLKSVPFKPKTQWLSDHPAYKLKVTIDGDRGTLFFECHFVDVKTGKVAAVVAANTDLARIANRWLITNFFGSTAELKI